jgi:hypothetical protein
MLHFYQNARRLIPEDSSLRSHYHENFKPYILALFGNPTVRYQKNPIVLIKFRYKQTAKAIYNWPWVSYLPGVKLCLEQSPF